MFGMVAQLLKCSTRLWICLFNVLRETTAQACDPKEVGTPDHCWPVKQPWLPTVQRWPQTSSTLPLAI